jgi:hypothetical protein
LSGIRILSIYGTRRPANDPHRHLRRDLAWLLAAKFAALGLLWMLFFSADYQPAIDATAASRQLALAAPTPATVERSSD